jgi:Nucleotidyltransferase domain
MNRQVIIDRVKAEVAELRVRFGVSRLALFGPVARGDDNEGSDLDILVTCRARTKQAAWSVRPDRVRRDRVDCRHRAFRSPPRVLRRGGRARSCRNHPRQESRRPDRQHQARVPDIRNLNLNRYLYRYLHLFLDRDEDEDEDEDED